MCGIAGLYDPAHLTVAPEKVAARMIDSLAHRGPDSRGVWCEAASGIALGHRRLAIIDLSPAGHQPMAASQGRYVVSYNGEIFNWNELRDELPAPEGGYRGHSDTEILLRCIEIWGIDATLARLIGFFAIALWDRQERRLTLIRDRLGIKPLYWAKAGGVLLFGSELRALRAHPSCPTAIDRDALAAYMRTATVPAPLSILSHVAKLAPGGRLDIAADGEARLSTYWDLRQFIGAGTHQRRKIAAADEVALWEDLLTDAVKRRMAADVPLGAFLSGGIDSSAVVALMQTLSSRKVRSYSIGFSEPGYDEAPFARRIAAHLGTEHSEFYVGAEDALAMVPRLAAIYDEPFADSSQIPTALICQLARQDVTVALSGDGGDEVFGGYNRYRLAERHWPRLAVLPHPLRQLLARLLTAPSPLAWDQSLGAILPVARLGDKVHKLGSVLGCRDLDTLYLRLISQWSDPAALAIGGIEPERLPQHLPADLGAMERFQAYDLLTYLPDDILTKVDRASMAVALEVRVPFLDHRLVERSWQVPVSAKLGSEGGKDLLKRILYRHVPKALLDRPKMGFGVPLERWLRGPLKDWAEALLDETRLKQQGYLNVAPIRHAWDQHQSGTANHQFALWTVLMFQAWLERWGD